MEDRRERRKVDTEGRIREEEGNGGGNFPLVFFSLCGKHYSYQILALFLYHKNGLCKRRATGVLLGFITKSLSSSHKEFGYDFVIALICRQPPMYRCLVHPL